MVNLEVLGLAVARAKKQSNKFGAAEQRAAYEEVSSHFKAAIVEQPDRLAELLDEQNETLSRIGNISAVRQEMEKAGLLPMKQGELSAFCRAVKAAEATLNGKT